MKKISIALCLLLFLSATIPFYANAQSNENFNINEGEMKFIVDSSELSIYQYKEDGILYETHETIKKVDGKDVINVKVYEIDGENKVLIDEGTTFVSEVAPDMIEVESEEGGKVLIDTGSNLVTNNAKNVSLRSASYGGSYIADVRYRISSDGSAQAIMNGQKPYYKNTRKNNTHFIRFQGHADGLRSKERDLVTLGVASFADDIIKALRAGNVLSWSLIKKVVGTAVKVGPFGAALTLYYYGKEWLGARDDYRKI
ncbi:hypothetical protein [Bacillus sp. FJAT-47783]|uniref:hypothetical protein n=1 Tax=Bacillus sp. FJAT-47783 TaxID=2922712 RepID=UPI001FABEC49|nr:hypothetical protein [Bacillus sp. FJAT-47783]